jgi:kumamolisin
MDNTIPQGYERLAGSERIHPAHARPIGLVDPQEHIAVSVYLRAPSSSNLANLRKQAQQEKRHLTRKEYADNQRADPKDLEKIREFARAHDLTIDEKASDPVARRVVLTGTAAAMSHAFATELQRFEYPGGTFRGRTGPLHVPSELDQIVVGVFGLDNRPQAQPHFKPYRSTASVFRMDAVTTSYTPRQLAGLYDFPTDVDGSGQCIALIELGGGYRQHDLKAFFQRLNVPLPKITGQSVDSGVNHPVGNPDSADGEVDLDIEVAGGIAPGAHIVVYFAPNTDQGFIDAITTAIHDTGTNPSVISISWGSAEMNWTAQAMTAMDQAFQAADALGITVLCAAGDAGSGDGASDNRAHVDFPASSPNVTGCGGTRLEASNNAVTKEVVWNEGVDSSTGGGVSDFFGLPPWQAQAGVPPSVNDKHLGRGVPDVAGDADPQTGYQVYVDRQDSVFGGTSAVAPLWAGLIALINQQQGQSIGFLNPILYQNYLQLTQSGAFRDVTSGNNGDYAAGPGWDACSGLGTPDGAKLLAALPGAKQAIALTA